MCICIHVCMYVYKYILCAQDLESITISFLFGVHAQVSFLWVLGVDTNA